MIKNKKNKDKNAHNKQEQQIMESVDDNKEGKYSIKALFKIYFQKMLMRIKKKKLKKLKFNKKKKRRKMEKRKEKTKEHAHVYTRKRIHMYTHLDTTYMHTQSLTCTH